jgi:small subunit ribosomal protein S1
VNLELPYGIEGYAALKAVAKEDGSLGEVGDKLAFEVIEFSKEEKKIVLSHSKIWEAPSAEEPKAEKKKTPSSKPEKAKLPEAEKSTLGDLSALAALKDQMESGEAPKKKATKKKGSDEEA